MRAAPYALWGAQCTMHKCQRYCLLDRGRAVCRALCGEGCICGEGRNYRRALHVARWRVVLIPNFAARAVYGRGTQSQSIGVHGVGV